MTVKNRSLDDLLFVMGRAAVAGNLGDLVKIAEKMKWANGYTMLQKSAVGIEQAVLSVNAGTGSELTAFLSSLQSVSFAVAAAARANSYDLHSVIGVLDEVAPTAPIVAEGQAAVVDVAHDGVVVLTPSKIVYLTAFSTELIRSVAFAAAAQRRAEIAIGRGLDAALLGIIAPGSGGNLGASSDALGDVAALISLINESGSQPLILGTTPTVATKMATLRQSGVLCFPGMVATGQGEVAGLPVSITDRITAGEMIVLDPSGMAITIDAIEVATSKNAALELLTSNLVQNAAQGTGASLVSMFQSSAVAFMISCSYGMAQLRSQDVSGSLDNISWANS